MPGETYQTLKDKYQKQSGAAVGAAMAAQAANVGGASSNQEFMGGAASTPNISTNIQQQGTSENVKKLIKEREKKKKEAEEQGGIYNIQTGEIELPEEEKKKTWLERLNIIGPSIKDPLERKKLELIRRAIENWQGNMPDYSFGELLAKTMGAMTMGRYKKLLGDKELYRDDDLGMSGIGSLEAAEGSPYPGSFTSEGLEDFIRNLDPEGNILGQLQRHHGDIYYSFNQPQTSGGIADLAGKAALQKNADGTGYITPDGREISLEVGKDYNNQIFAARADLDRMGKDMFGNIQGGGQEYGGGSGGGGGAQNANARGGTGLPIQGFKGGDCTLATTPYPTGGGGGAGAVGVDGSSASGNGGVGLSSSITGSAVTRGGGGGGALYNAGTAGSGGTGGGGNGGSNSSHAGVAGTVNTGGGGGGAHSGAASGAGGSGIVILRYATADATITVGSGLTSSSSTSGSDTIISFTAGTGTVSFA